MTQQFANIKEAVAHARGLLTADVANYCDFQASGVRIVVQYNWDATRINVSITKPHWNRILHKTTSDRLSQSKAQEIIGDTPVRLVDFGK